MYNLANYSVTAHIDICHSDINNYRLKCILEPCTDAAIGSDSLVINDSYSDTISLSSTGMSAITMSEDNFSTKMFFLFSQRAAMNGGLQWLKQPSMPSAKSGWLQVT